MAVDLYIIDDNGHAWPGGDDDRPPGLVAIAGPSSTAIVATDVMWAFFDAHRRP